VDDLLSDVPRLVARRDGKGFAPETVGIDRVVGGTGIDPGAGAIS
jgi:hypothetical protein